MTDSAVVHVSSASKEQKKPKKKQSKKVPDRPRYSYTVLIAMALMESSNGCLQVGAIYRFIQDRFPNYCIGSSNWKNSIRHSLSKKLNFIKVNCANGTHGKRASYWGIAPKRLALLQAEVRRAKIRMCDPSILSEISSSIVPPTQFIHSKSHEVNLLCPSGDSSFSVTFGTTKYTYTPQNKTLPEESHKDVQRQDNADNLDNKLQYVSMSSTHTMPSHASIETIHVTSLHNFYPQYTYQQDTPWIPDIPIISNSQPPHQYFTNQMNTESSFLFAPMQPSQNFEMLNSISSLAPPSPLTQFEGIYQYQHSITLSPIALDQSNWISTYDCEKILGEFHFTTDIPTIDPDLSHIVSREITSSDSTSLKHWIETIEPVNINDECSINTDTAIQSNTQVLTIDDFLLDSLLKSKSINDLLSNFNIDVPAPDNAKLNDEVQPTNVSEPCLGLKLHG